jgi:hypothetical protein
MRNRWIASMFAILAGLAFLPVTFAQTAGLSGAKTSKDAAHPPALTGVWLQPSWCHSYKNRVQDPCQSTTQWFKLFFDSS